MDSRSSLRNVFFWWEFNDKEEKFFTQNTPLIFNSILGVFSKSLIGFPRWVSALLGDVDSPLTPGHRLSSDTLSSAGAASLPFRRALGRLCCPFSCPGYKGVCPQKQELGQWSHCSARGCDITMAQRKQGWGRQSHPKLLAAFNFVWCIMNETLTLNCTSSYHVVVKKNVFQNCWLFLFHKRYCDFLKKFNLKIKGPANQYFNLLSQ